MTGSFYNNFIESPYVLIIFKIELFGFIWTRKETVLLAPSLFLLFPYLLRQNRTQKFSQL